MRIVYAYLVMDILHYGHLRMLRQAKGFAGRGGKLVVGILTDQAVMERKPPPTLSYEHRFEIAQSISHIDAVIEQTTYSPVANVKLLVPDILIESDSHTNEDIERSRRVAEAIGTQVEIIAYTPGISSTLIKSMIRAG